MLHALQTQLTCVGWCVVGSS